MYIHRCVESRQSGRVDGVHYSTSKMEVFWENKVATTKDAGAAWPSDIPIIPRFQVAVTGWCVEGGQRNNISTPPQFGASRAGRRARPPSQAPLLSLKKKTAFSCNWQQTCRLSLESKLSLHGVCLCVSSSSVPTTSSEN